MLLKVNTVISRALLPCQVSDYEQYGCYIILFIRLGQTIHLYLFIYFFYITTTFRFYISLNFQVSFLIDVN